MHKSQNPNLEKYPRIPRSPRRLRVTHGPFRICFPAHVHILFPLLFGCTVEPVIKSSVNPRACNLDRLVGLHIITNDFVGVRRLGQEPAVKKKKKDIKRIKAQKRRNPASFVSHLLVTSPISIFVSASRTPIRKRCRGGRQGLCAILGSPFYRILNMRLLHLPVSLRITAISTSSYRRFSRILTSHRGRQHTWVRLDVPTCGLDFSSFLEERAPIPLLRIFRFLVRRPWYLTAEMPPTLREISLESCVMKRMSLSLMTGMG